MWPRRRRKDVSHRVSCGKQKFRVPVQEGSDIFCSKFKYKRVVIIYVPENLECVRSVYRVSVSPRVTISLFNIIWWFKFFRSRALWAMYCFYFTNRSSALDGTSVEAFFFNKHHFLRYDPYKEKNAKYSKLSTFSVLLFLSNLE